jgi:hypothetical protein
MVEGLALPGHRIDASDILALAIDIAIDGKLIMQGGTGNFQGQFLCYTPPFFYTKRA